MNQELTEAPLLVLDREAPPEPPPPAPYRFVYTPALDGLRALAVAMVFLFHAPYGSKLASGGHIGVDVFLVLSGFLITSILAGEWQRTGTFSLRKFYLRRLLRLSPAVLFCTTVICFFDWLHGHIDLWSIVLYYRALLLYYVNLGPWIGLRVPLGLAHCWSLSLEEQFYVIWPLLLLLMLRHSARRAFWGSAGLFAVATLWECWLSASGAPNDRIYLWLDTRANAVLLGAAMAMLPHVMGLAWTRRFAERLSAVSIWLVGVIVAGMGVIPEPGTLKQPMTLPIIVATAALIVAFTFGPAHRVRGWFERPGAVWVGRLSYSIYLWHFPILTWASLHFSPMGSLFGRDPIALGLTLCFSWATYRLVERPFLSLKTRFES
ncbi:MAG TPA: acyltransferase [Candidatus Xenobia bacterium]|jgi:peptidoglycan/LPS O-acetylase OafA/YrhL